MALESVFAQESDAWTLTVIDGSPLEENLSDDIRKLVVGKASYVRNDKHITIGGNWNIAFELVQDGLFSLLHEDDLLHPQYVSKMLQLANRYDKSGLYYCGARVINDQGRSKFTVADLVKRMISPTPGVRHLHNDSGLNDILKGCFIFCPTVIYNRKVLGDIRFDDALRMVLDLDLYARLLLQGGTITGMSDVLFTYRRHENSQTQKLSSDFERYKEEIRLYNQLSESAQQQGWSLSAKRARHKTIIKLHLFYQMLHCFLTLKFKDLLRVFRFISNAF